MKHWRSEGMSALLPFSRRVVILIVIRIFISHSLHAQYADFKSYEINNLTTEDFNIQNDIIDDNSQAVYLYDLGDSNVDVNSTEVTLEFSRSFRIKILSEQGLDLGDQIVELAVNGSDEEKIGKVKGGVYNLVNGKIEFEKLRNNDWLVEESDATTKLARLRFKNVKVGSIIELSYTIYSPFLVRMPNWDFQHDFIPVIYSEYCIRYPQMLSYKILQMGYHPLLGSSHNIETQVNSGVAVSTKYTYKDVFVLACENIPAMRAEPLMDSPENYRTRVITELNYVDFPGEKRKYFFEDWEGSIEKFIDGRFNEQYMNPNKRLQYFNLDNSVCETLSDSVREIYNHIRLNYSNSGETNYITPHRNPRQVLASHRATSSEINWILVSTLRANGIKAYPVLVSTRSSPRILKNYPVFTQYSSCLVAVKDLGNYTLLDATSQALKAGELSEYYYNGDGLIVNTDSVEWIPIVGNSRTTEKCAIEFKSLEDNTLSGQMRLQLSGLYRTRMAMAILKGDKSSIIDNLPITKNAELQLNEVESDFDANPMDLHFDINLKLEKFGDSYLLPAVIFADKANNILKSKERLYPLNFPDAWEESYTCMVHLENGKYQVSLPENANYKLPDTDGKFLFLGRYDQGSLLIINKIEMNKSSFSPSEYPALRQFYDLISTTHSSFIEISEK